MANNFFKNGDKGYSENLNDSVLVGNAFDWTVSISLPDDTGDVFPDSSDIDKAKVCDVSITPNGNLSIGSTISNSSGSDQVYRLTVYPNFNRFGGFQSITLTADTGVTFYIANKDGTTPIANNLDYTDLSNVPELQVLKQYDIVITIPTGKSVTGLDFVLQSSSADVAAEISQANVTDLTTDLSSIDGRLDDLEAADSGIYFYRLYASTYNPTIDSSITVYCEVTDINGDPVSGKTLTLSKANNVVGTAQTNNSGTATWTGQTINNWDVTPFQVADSVIQVKAKGWKSISTSTGYDIYANGEFVRIDFHVPSNATVPEEYGPYSLPSSYYPKYNVANISSSEDENAVHFAVFSATTSGELRIRLHKSTYGVQPGGITIYGMLVYPY